MNNPSKDNIDEMICKPKKKIHWKQFFIESVVSLVILSLIGLGVGFISVYSKGFTFEKESFRILCDSFFVSGILGICFWLLLFVSREGGFDLLVYGCKKLFLYTFTSKKHAAEKMPESYVEYVEMKREKRKDLFFGLLVCSSLYFILSLIFLFLTK